jgi:hypothetical protein
MRGNEQDVVEAAPPPLSPALSGRLKRHAHEAGVQCIGTVKPGGAPSGAAGTVAAPKSIQEREMDFRKRRLDKLEAEQKAKQDKEQADAKRAMCENARARVMGLQRGGRVARYDSSGQIQYLDEEAIAKEVADAQRMADEACK